MSHMVDILLHCIYDVKKFCSFAKKRRCQARFFLLNVILYFATAAASYLFLEFGTIVSFGMAFLWVLILHPLIQKISRE